MKLIETKNKVVMSDTHKKWKKIQDNHLQDDTDVIISPTLVKTSMDDDVMEASKFSVLFLSS